MNRLIDRSLTFLFRLAERLTSECSAGIKQSDDTPKPPSTIRFTKEDKWIQGELFD